MRYRDIERELRERGEHGLADQLRSEVNLDHDVTRFDAHNEIWEGQTRRAVEDILIEHGEP